MTEVTTNLLLEYMRKFERILADMRADRHDMREDLQGANRRPSNLEEGQAFINQRLDRLDARVRRVENVSIRWRAEPCAQQS